MKKKLLIAIFLYSLPTLLSAVNTIVTMKYSNGHQEQFLYVDGRYKGFVKENKVHFTKLTKAGKLRNKVFFEQVDNLHNYGICLKFPEVVYDDAIIISGILNTLDSIEVKSMSKFYDDTTIISLNNINHYYTFVNERVDFVHSIKIKVVHNKIVSYEYVSNPEMSEQIIKLHCTLEYDKEGRITKYTSVYNGQKDVIWLQYDSVPGNVFSVRQK